MMNTTKNSSGLIHRQKHKQQHQHQQLDIGVLSLTTNKIEHKQLYDKEKKNVIVCITCFETIKIF